jgi:hypothetical protein
VEIINL